MANTTEFKKWLVFGLGIVSLAVGIASTPTVPPSEITAQSQPAPTPQNTPVDFNRDVRPILSQHCWPCHGPDRAKVEETGGLRLDSHAEATKDRDGRQAIVPGDPDASWIIKRAAAPVEALRMPPPTSVVEPLTPQQIDILKRWIKEGANYADHWAFIAPVKPQVPGVKDANWPKNPIDNFILAKLESQGLTPEKEADRPTLIRRVALTLTGLPPTLEELYAFLADQSPDAYAKMVDRYLASVRYGEHQARYWLDAVRYGDTHGLHLDNYREVYPYRDWVVRAFNADLPYDDFVLWQLAGDLLPQPTLDQQIASGYVRMNVTTSEGGAIEKEFLVKNTADRVDTTSTVLLGVTMACARCHDHKYDPITHEDYYELFAYFNSTEDPVLDGNSAVHPPIIKAPNPEQVAEDKRLTAELRSLESQVPDKTAVDWMNGILARVPTVGKWLKAKESYQAVNFETAVNTAYPPEDPANLTKVEWEDIAINDGTRINDFIKKSSAAGYLLTNIEAPVETEYTFQMGADDAIKVWLNGELVHNNPALGGLVPNSEKVKVTLKKGKNTLLVKVINGGGPDGFMVTYGDDAFQLVQKARDKDGRINTQGEGMNQAKSLYLRAQSTDGLPAKYKETYAEHQALLASIPTTLIAKEMAEPRPAFVLHRGEYDQERAPVQRQTIDALNPMPKGAPNNRLGLAQWMLDPANPLFSRVYVNRLWQNVFGIGIVETSEDFGSQGNFPTHPELLDWLAVTFRDEGWSNKDMLRLLLNSATFKQESRLTQKKRELDPRNRYLSRGPRYRLDAEVIRDQALLVSGLLNGKIGGPGVRPYQPPGLWEAVGYEGSNTVRYTQDTGEKLYRRSLYMFWKRTSPPAVMAIFDAPTREACVVRRARTNTPMQALATMNETAFVESARFMAERLMARSGTIDQKIELAFRIATARPASQNEIKIVADFYQRQKATFQQDMAAAEKLLAVGEKPRNAALDPADHAAWTMVCNLVLNLDETLTIN